MSAMRNVAQSKVTSSNVVCTSLTPRKQCAHRQRIPLRINCVAATAGPLVAVVPESVKSSGNLPRPSGNAGWPLIGESIEFHEKGPLMFGLERQAKFGPVFKTSLWGKEWVMVTDANIAKALLLEDTKLVNFDTTGAFARLHGEFAIEFLGNKDGMRMPTRRRLLTALTVEALSGYALKIGEITERELKEVASKDSVELTDVTRKWGMEYANTLLAGLEGYTPEEMTSIRNDLRDFFEGLFGFDIDLPGTAVYKAVQARDRLMKLIGEAVQEQITEIAADKSPAIAGARPRKNMLGYLVDSYLAEGITPSVRTLAQLALGVLQAGTDTSSSGFNFLTTVLAERPDIVEKLREEQNAIIEKFGPGYNKASLDAMTYTEAVIREGLRINTPGVAQTRITLQDITVAGYLIPKGTSLFLNYDTAHALDLMPELNGMKDYSRLEHMDLLNLKESFKPERFLVDKDKQPTLMTFGHGAHVCVGIGLYIMEAKCLAAEMVRKYDISLRSSGPITWQKFPGVTPREPVYLSMKPRST